MFACTVSVTTQHVVGRTDEGVLLAGVVADGYNYGAHKIRSLLQQTNEKKRGPKPWVSGVHAEAWHTIVGRQAGR